jgi:hypothetical protein
MNTVKESSGLDTIKNPSLGRNMATIYFSPCIFVACFCASPEILLYIEFFWSWSFEHFQAKILIPQCTPLVSLLKIGYASLNAVTKQSL